MQSWSSIEFIALTFLIILESKNYEHSLYSDGGVFERMENIYL